MKRYSGFSSSMSVPHVHLPLLYFPLKESLSITPQVKHCHLLGHLCSPQQWSLLSFMHPLWCSKHSTCHSWLSSSVVFYFDVPRSTEAWPLYTWCLRIHTEQMMMGKMKVLISTYTLASTKLSTCQCGKVEKTKAETQNAEKKIYVHQTINK